MAKFSRTRCIMMWLLYLTLSAVILFFQLIPLHFVPSNFVGPDFLMAITFAWTIRRPEFVPTPLVAVAYLLADFLLQRPPGLLSLLVILGCKLIKTQSMRLRTGSFTNEWIFVGCVISTVILFFWIIQALVGLNQAPIDLNLVTITVTFLIYPLIVIISHMFFMVRKSRMPTEDMIG